MKHLIYSDIAVRLSLNPFGWAWAPWFTRDKPTPFFPKRNTIGFGWLFLQVFIDIDNGERDMKKLAEMMMGSLDAIEVADEQD